jgi:hypothetical protein
MSAFQCDNRMENPANSDPTYSSNRPQSAGAGGAAGRNMEPSSPLAPPGSMSSNAQSRWSPYGLCSSPPARRRTAPASRESAIDRFIPCRAPLDSKMSNYLLAASTDEQDYESTPSKQDYMNTLKESVLLSQGDAMVLPLRASGAEHAGASGAGERTLPSSVFSSSSKRRRTMRFIPKSPDKILDAPDLVARVCVCVPACVRASVRACVCVCECMCVYVTLQTIRDPPHELLHSTNYCNPLTTAIPLARAHTQAGGRLLLESTGLE